MKQIFCATVSVLFLFCTILTATADSAPEGSDDKTFSPYFLVQSDDASVDQLPLKSTAARVRIAGVIADVLVTQVYENQGQKPLEAIYVFPASTRAAVYGMKMTIGERTIVADIREREAARQEYEAAKQAGQSASLLEQQRPNVFQMNVANILPGDVIRVELRYTELLVPTDGIYSFVYPTVVGPRYSNVGEADAPSGEEWVQNPYLHEGEPPPYTFDFTARISAGMPIDSVTCPTHETEIRFENPALAVMELADTETGGGDRDLILKYRLSGGRIESGLLLYEGEKENFFLLMMQPPQRVNTKQIPSREYVFIVDVSGSMRGFPLEVSKTLLRNLIGGLRPSDRFNVLLFAGGNSLLSERSLPADSENVQQAIQVIDRQRGGGGTELLPALQRALDLPQSEKGISRSFIVVTDGYVRVEKEAFDLIRNSLNEANLFAFGIGSSVNRFLIEGMARAGMGEPFVVTRQGEASSKAEQLREYIHTPVLTDVSVEFDGFSVYDVEPPAIPDVLAQRPVTVFGKWRGRPSGTIRLSGVTGTEPYSARLSVGQHPPDPVNSALRYLWARYRIALLSDYQQVTRDNDLKETITRLGLTYNLLTAYTSFVAIDSRVRRTGDTTTTVKQPLPLPRGVPEAAVGAPAPQMRMARSPGVGAAKPNMFSMMPSAEPDAAPVTPSEDTVSGSRVKAKKRTDRAEETLPPPVELQIRHRADRITVQGDLNRTELKGLLEQHLKELERCIHLVQARGYPVQRGEAILRLEIGADGTVTSAEFLFPGAGRHPALKRCIESLAARWTTSRPGDGNPVTVTYLLEFAPRT